MKKDNHSSTWLISIPTITVEGEKFGWTYDDIASASEAIGEWEAEEDDEEQEEEEDGDEEDDEDEEEGESAEGADVRKGERSTGGVLRCFLELKKVATCNHFAH